MAIQPISTGYTNYSERMNQYRQYGQHRPYNTNPYMSNPYQSRQQTPVYNGVNIEIHIPQTNYMPPETMPNTPLYENEGDYAYDRKHVYDIPQVSVYDAPNTNMIFPQATKITKPEKPYISNHHVTNPIQHKPVQPEQKQAEQNIKTVSANQQIQKNVEEKAAQQVINTVKNEEIKKEEKKEINKTQVIEKTETKVAPQKIEIVAPQDIKPVIDINTFIAELTNPNYERQLDAMGTLVQVINAAPEVATQLLDSRIVDALLDIVSQDTSKLDAPSQEQIAYREAMLRGEQLSQNQINLANRKAPVENAEQNKEYAIYTLAAMQKLYSSEVEKMGGKTVPLRELPAEKEILKEISTNLNPHVKIAGLSALNYIQRPEYKEDLITVYSNVAKDENPMVSEVALKAIELLG